MANIMIWLLMCLSAFAADSVGSVYHTGTQLRVRFTNAPSHFILECSTNLVDWTELSEHQRINQQRPWLAFDFNVTGLEQMEYWRLRDCAMP